jgi:hypothetical protein
MTRSMGTKFLKGPVQYYLRGSEGYCIDANARIKPFRLIPKLVNQVVPVVVISKDSGTLTLFHAHRI